MVSSPGSRIYDKIEELHVKAKTLYNIITFPEYRLSKRMSSSLGNCTIYRSKFLYKINITGKALYSELLLKEILDNTLSHELAHYIQFRLYDKLGHDKIWKSIDRSLGGSGNSCFRPTSEFMDAVNAELKANNCKPLQAR